MKFCNFFLFFLLLPIRISGYSQPETTPIRAIAWHPKDDVLAVIQTNDEVWLWSVSLQRIVQIPIDNQLVGRLAWSPNGNKLAISTYAGPDEGRIYIWSYRTSKLTNTIRQNYNGASDISWYIDNVQLAANKYEVVNIWDTDTGKILNTITPTKQPNAVGVVAWSHDGSKLMTTGGRVQIWDTANLINPQIVKLENIRGNIIWSPDDKFLALGSTNKVYIWNVENSELEISLTGYSDSIVELTWENSRLATWSWDNKIHIWNTDTWKLLEVFEGSNVQSSKGALALSPDGTQLAYAGENGELTIISTL